MRVPLVYFKIKTVFPLSLPGWRQSLRSQIPFVVKIVYIKIWET